MIEDRKDASSKCVIAPSLDCIPTARRVPRNNREKHRLQRLRESDPGSRFTNNSRARAHRDRISPGMHRSCVYYCLIGAHPYKSHANISHSPGTHYPASTSNRPRPKRITSDVHGAVWKGRRPETKFLSTSRSTRIPFLALPCIHIYSRGASFHLVSM